MMQRTEEHDEQGLINSGVMGVYPLDSADLARSFNNTRVSDFGPRFATKGVFGFVGLSNLKYFLHIAVFVPPCFASLTVTRSTSVRYPARCACAGLH